MIVFVVVIVGILVAIAAVGIFFLAGSRGRPQEIQDQQNAAKTHRQSVPHQPQRSDGRGEL